MNERGNKPDNRMSEMPAKQTENKQWHEQKPANPATRQITYSFSKRRQNDASLVQNIE